MKNTAVLLITCPDRKGIVAAVAEFLYKHDANILHADQHQDAERGLFLMRVEWDLTGFALDLVGVPAPVRRHRRPLRHALAAGRLSTYRCGSRCSCRSTTTASWTCSTGTRPASCRCDIPLIVANHPDAERWAKFYGVPFHLIPGAIPARRKRPSRSNSISWRPRKIDLVVLARYMQVLSKEFVAKYPQRVINVHHSFLPAFMGAKPYHRAFERGVKLIGATSHYATADLDEGPIIEQDVVRISHRDGLEDLLEKGRDLEKVVLSRAVRWHIDHRILRLRPQDGDFRLTCIVRLCGQEMRNLGKRGHRIDEVCHAHGFAWACCYATASPNMPTQSREAVREFKRSQLAAKQGLCQATTHLGEFDVSPCSRIALIPMLSGD